MGTVPRRRVGSEQSATRQKLLDAVERLMLDEGYAAVTYRAVAARAEVTAGLVQYYFPTLDDLFVAAIRRRSEQNLARLQAALADGRHPLVVLWEYANNEANAALTTEFMALGNHRPSIRDAISTLTHEIRQVQLGALAAVPPGPVTLTFTPEAFLFLINGIPKIVQLEDGVGVDAGHDEILATIERHLAELP